MATIRLRVRKDANSPWVENFSRNGWKLRDSANSNWLQMTPVNTKVRSADNTQWLNVK